MSTRRSMDVRDAAALEELFADVDAVICLPYYLNTVVVTAAHSAGVHYLDLSEDVATSRTVRQLAQSSNTIWMPCCGLAPGFICIVGGALAAGLETVERIELRVGALPRSPNNAAGYACNWSSAGLVNEYLNDCEQLRGGEVVSVPSLSDPETVVIDGARLRGVHHLGRPRDDVRNVRRTCRPPRLQDDPVSRSLPAHAVHAAGAWPWPAARRPCGSSGTPTRPSGTIW